MISRFYGHVSSQNSKYMVTYGLYAMCSNYDQSFTLVVLNGCIIVLYGITRYRVSCKFKFITLCLHAWGLISRSRSMITKCHCWHSYMTWFCIFCRHPSQGLPGAIDNRRTCVGIKIYAGGNEVHDPKGRLCSRDSLDNGHQSTSFCPVGSADRKFQAIQGVTRQIGRFVS